MSIRSLPPEILILIINGLSIEDQFNLALTCKSLQSIARSDLLCRAGLEVEHRFSTDFEDALRTGNFAKAWRRLVKKHAAIKTASPFQACLLALADQFVFSHGALMYKPSRAEIRVLFLNGSFDEELHIDTKNIVAESRRLFVCDYGTDDVVEPFYYACGLATFLVSEGDFGYRNPELLFADIHHRRLLNRYSLASANSIFVRNTERYLWIGERSSLPSETRCWYLRMLDLQTQVWGEATTLPAVFCSSKVNQDICFEIIDEHLYGAQSMVDVASSRTVHHIIRMPVDGGQELEHAYRKIDRRDGHWDSRFNELKLIRDACTGAAWVYEVRKEFLSQGYSERVCQRYCISFEDSIPHNRDTSQSFAEPFEITTAESSNGIHKGVSGLGIIDSDPRLLLLHVYDAETRSFLDVVKEPIANKQTTPNVYLRSKTQVSGHETSFGSTSTAYMWPPRGSMGNNHRSLQMLMNPLRDTPDTARWYFWNGLLVFSPITRDSNGPRPVVLLSFDPGLHVPGLRRECHLSMDTLVSLPERMGSEWYRGLNWIARVKPFHLVIRSLEKDHCRLYGLDFGYNRLT